MKNATVPVIHYDEARATSAFEAHRALLFAERAKPYLRDNPAWAALRADAYANFELAFEGKL